MLTLALLGRCDCQQTSGVFRASAACLWGWGVNDYTAGALVAQLATVIGGD